MTDDAKTQEWIKEKLKKARSSLKEKKYSRAAKLFEEAAKEYEKDSSLISEALKYYTQAAKAYFSAGKKEYNKFKDLILKTILALITDPWEKVDALIDGANHLLKVGEFKKGAELVSGLKDVYKKELNDKEKAKFYEDLAKEVKQGTVKQIANPK